MKYNEALSNSELQQAIDSTLNALASATSNGNEFPVLLEHYGKLAETQRRRANLVFVEEQSE